MTKILRISICLLLIIINFEIVHADENNHNVTIDKIVTTSINDVDITWDSMKFIYYEEEKYIYDTNTHMYKKNINTYWDKTNNNIKLKNNSYMDMFIKLNYNVINKKIDIKFNNNNFILKHNETKNIKLDINGKLNKDNNLFSEIGTISVVVS